jgi:hypothetical protein
LADATAVPWDAKSDESSFLTLQAIAMEDAATMRNKLLANFISTPLGKFADESFFPLISNLIQSSKVHTGKVGAL